MMATTVPHGMATHLIDKLCGIELSVKAMQDMVERRGAAVLELDVAESRAHDPLDDKGLPLAEQPRPQDAASAAAPPAVAYVELDGVVPITREELTGKDLVLDCQMCLHLRSVWTRLTGPNARSPGLWEIDNMEQKRRTHSSLYVRPVVVALGLLVGPAAAAQEQSPQTEPATVSAAQAEEPAQPEQAGDPGPPSEPQQPQPPAAEPSAGEAAPQGSAPAPKPTALPATPRRGGDQVEEIVVTGSRIRTNPLDRPAPVLSLSGEDLVRTGLTSVGDVLQRLPASGGAINSKFNQSGNAGFAPDGGGTGAGSAEADLRYLGSKRVLVLVDGIRWVPGSAASGLPGSSDLNTIPMSIIERIEVLQDGASTIYGSDAIGGVINIITKKRYEGIEANAYVGGFQQGDGATQQYDLTWGTTADRASMIMGLSYVKQEAVSSADRDISKYATPGVPECTAAACSSATPRGRFSFSDSRYIDPNPNIGDRRNITLRPDVILDASGKPRFTPTDPTGPGSDFEAFDATDRFNFQPYNFVVTPSERIGAFTQVQYRILSALNMSAKLLFNNRQSRNRAAPEPLFMGPGAGTGTRTDRLVIDATNPYNPFQMTFDESVNWAFYRRAFEAGPRIFDQNVNTWYASGGFDGGFTIAERSFVWDATLVYSRNRADQVKYNGFNAARMEKALGPLAVCQADPACVPLNIFGGPGADGKGTMTRDMLDYVTYEQHDLSQQQLWDFVANVTGDIAQLPAGSLSIAAGVEHRRHDGFFRPDSIVAAGDTADIPAKPSSGEYNVTEAYLETLIPVLADLPGVAHLDLSAAVRISDYSTFGTEDTYKVAVRWRPLEELLFRGSYAQGFRAPTIGELFGTPGRYDANMNDPCSSYENAPAQTRQNCIELGVPAAYEQDNPQISVTTGGNPNLQPEMSTGIVASIVYSPSWVKQNDLGDLFDLEVNYFHVELDNAITTDPQVYLGRCVATLDPAFCEGIVRLPDGTITGFNNRLRNIGGITTSGIDWSVSYVSPGIATGHLRLAWIGSYLLDFVERYPDSGGLDRIDREGLELGDPERAYPRLKSSGILSWLSEDWRASWSVRYIGSVTEKCTDLGDYPGTCSDPDLRNDESSKNKLGATVYNDVQFSWAPAALERKLSITLGVNNLLDQDPPTCYSCALNGFDATTYDAPGVFGYIRAGYRL